jgi:hypothetical protein
LDFSSAERHESFDSEISPRLKTKFSAPIVRFLYVTIFFANVVALKTPFLKTDKPGASFETEILLYHLGDSFHFIAFI